MSYTVVVEKAALKALKKMSVDTRQRITSKLAELAQNPLAKHLDIKALTDREYQYRLRVGDWRIIYEIYHDRLVILVVTIASRGGVYQK